MSDLAIELEGLGKEYRLGATLRPATLGETLVSGIKSLFRRETSSRGRDTFWALKELSLSVKPGERVGVIGRNGAGKTTLLKILSRITPPTTGRARLSGRVASLLEVGTGFHPELTGRENVYLNGAILGMSRAEMRRKFDPIVAFAEVETFIDTPVKRYSSGMHARLAFAVAAHLEPEILIVDEVLSVGDVRFQEKCMGKMRSIGDEGRTILFVTHQMGMVSQLCTRAILLEDGRLALDGAPAEVVADYVRRARRGDERRLLRDEAAVRGKAIVMTDATTKTSAGLDAGEFGYRDPFVLDVRGDIRKFVPGACLGVAVCDGLGRRVFTSQIALEAQGVTASTRTFAARMTVPAPFLAPGKYSFLLALHVPNVEVLDRVEDVCPVRIVDTGSEMAIHEGADYGCVMSPCTWEVESCQ